MPGPVPGANETVAPPNGVSVALSKSPPIPSPVGAAAGLTRGVTAMDRVALAASVIPVVAKVTAPEVLKVALAKGMPTRPVLDEKLAPSSDALNQRVPARSFAVAAVGACWPPVVTR